MVQTRQKRGKETDKENADSPSKDPKPSSTQVLFMHGHAMELTPTYSPPHSRITICGFVLAKLAK